MEHRLDYKVEWLCWLGYAILAIILLAFWEVSHGGFFREDDLAMGLQISSLSDVLRHTKMFYLTRGGRWFSVACQYLFAGFFRGNKLWFDVFNTLFFILLLVACGQLIRPGRKDVLPVTLLFALLFWFLCPAPMDSIFWLAGAVTYLWAVSLTLLFLVIFFRSKDKDFGIGGKIGLFLLSAISATEFVSCVSICGAFTVYYLLHFKELKKNAIPMVSGFVLGTLVVLLAPGNFARAAWEGMSFTGKLYDLANHPLYELSKYKALWLFVVVLVFGWLRNKTAVKGWLKDNTVMVLSLGWSVIAFSVVFRPLDRALFFPETIALVLLLKFCYDNQPVLEIRNIQNLIRGNQSIVQYICIGFLSVAFAVDAVHGVAETRRQHENRDALMVDLVASGGVTALDRMVPAHRMAYAERFPRWTWEPLALMYGLDSVRVYPYYCQDKFYTRSEPGLENTFVEEVHVDDDSFGRQVRMIVRVKEEDASASNGHATFTTHYTRPRKWYKSWLDKVRNYQYDRVSTNRFRYPETCYGGYAYYVIWLKRENAANLKRVQVSFDS